jgi:hypothetical protein
MEMPLAPILRTMRVEHDAPGAAGRGPAVQPDPGMTPTGPWPSSRPPCRTPSTWIQSGMTWPLSCRRPSNPPMSHDAPTALDGGRKVRKQAIIEKAADLLSGPGGLASFLRTRLLGARLAGPSLPLDVGPSDQIPAAIRRAVILRDQHCRWAGGYFL